MLLRPPPSQRRRRAPLHKLHSPPRRPLSLPVCRPRRRRLPDRQPAGAPALPRRVRRRCAWSCCRRARRPQLAPLLPRLTPPMLHLSALAPSPAWAPSPRLAALQRRHRTSLRGKPGSCQRCWSNRCKGGHLAMPPCARRGRPSATWAHWRSAPALWRFRVWARWRARVAHAAAAGLHRGRAASLWPAFPQARRPTCCSPSLHRCRPAVRRNPCWSATLAPESTHAGRWRKRTRQNWESWPWRR
mmetsp:Transcript_110963/g.318828  ORF Transcript_110963/g.318828 Transcript_110963/m.318828 type:complete len:244 (-) Transcript_110963:93-824(-)